MTYVPSLSSLQVTESFGGSGPAKSLYHHRTGDILDDSTLSRLKALAERASFGAEGRTDPCDRLLDDLRRKAAAGELNYIAVFADGGDMVPRIGPVSERYRVSTETRIDGVTTDKKLNLGGHSRRHCILFMYAAVCIVCCIHACVTCLQQMVMVPHIVCCIHVRHVRLTCLQQTVLVSSAALHIFLILLLPRMLPFTS
jgi:hypothetical protein